IVVNLICVLSSTEIETFANKTLAFSNPNDPNKPKPAFVFGQSQPSGSSTPGTPGPTTLQQPQTAFGLSSTPAGNPPLGTGAFGRFTVNPDFASGTTTSASAPASIRSFGFGAPPPDGTSAPANQTGFVFRGTAGTTASAAPTTTSFGQQTETKQAETKPLCG